MLKPLTPLVLFCTFSVAAQQHITVYGAEGDPLAGAVLTFGNEQKIEIADSNGKVPSNQTFPFFLQVSHLGYRTFSDSIYSKDQLTISLLPEARHLKDIVITGQHTPQSAKNSVYSVRTITNERLEAQGVSSIEEVLTNQLNFQFSRDNATGSSNVNMLGLGGQYVKILIDGIPVEGRSGTNNSVDLGQINVQSIDRIELVEGPMSVNYGADALAGVINIITKKEAAEGVEANITIHEETIGKAYSLFSEGLHSPALSLGFKLNQWVSMRIESRIRQFGGWQGEAVGREKSWYPKLQYFNGAVFQVTLGSIEGHYRLDWLDERLQNLGPKIASSGLIDPYAIDEDYLTTRWQHQLHLEKVYSKGSFQGAFSISDYERNIHQYSTNLITNQRRETVASEQDTTRFDNAIGRITWNHRSGKLWSLQAGLEGEQEQGSGTRLTDGAKEVFDLSVFSSLEWSVNNFKIRPGIRLNYNSLFSTVPAPSVNIQYTLGRSILRFGYGRGYRAPSLRELYHEFIDTNHNILGNEDLKPEQSHSFNARVDFEASPKLSFSLGSFYNHIDNQITTYTPTGNEATTYTNLLLYKTNGINLNMKWSTGPLRLESGFAYVGEYQDLSVENQDVPQFAYAPQANVNLTYELGETGYQLSGFFKYTGAQRRYSLSGEEPETEAVLGQIDAYTNLDLTIMKSFKALSVNLGVRNATNVIQVANSLVSTGAHGNAGNQTSVSYGRSYFLRINYQFKYKNKTNEKTDS